MRLVLRRSMLAVAFAGGAVRVHAQAQVERNVVYGTYSGLALLMDVHRPVQPNGIAVLCIPGSGWSNSLGYDARLLNRLFPPDLALGALMDAGYTVFVASHRALPRFPHPAALEDVQRAIRFIRANASRYSVDSNRIGALGGSSGGHLVSMAGVLDGAGDPNDADPVNRVSAKVQAVVAVSAPTDLRAVNTPIGSAVVAQLVGVQVQPLSGPAPQSPEYKRYVSASPVTYVTPDDPPFLLVHGEADNLIPFAQAQVMAAELKRAGVMVKLLAIAGGGHGSFFQLKRDDPQLPAFEKQAVAWFDTYLRTSR